MPKIKTTGAFIKAAQEHAVESTEQSDAWRQLLQLVDAEINEMLRDIPLDLIIEEAAFFRVALRLRNDEISGEKKQGKQKSMDAVVKRKQISQKYFDDAVGNLKKANKKINPKTVAQELIKMNDKYLECFPVPSDPSIKQIYVTKKTKLSKVFITEGFIKTACQRYKMNLETSSLAIEILETY